MLADFYFIFNFVCYNFRGLAHKTGISKGEIQGEVVNML